MTTGMIRAAAAAVLLAAGATAAAAQSPMTKEQVERRYNVRVFGNVLISAAQHGAELMALRVQQIDPGVILLSRITPRAQGFVIDGHGVFFHVEIPNVDPVIAWAVTNRGRDQAAEEFIDNIKRLLQKETDPQERARLEQGLRRMEQRLLPPGSQRQESRGAIPMAGMAPSAPPAPAPIMTNPNMEYERLVTEQLINAMLDHSHQLGLSADEWLTIAARGSQGPLIAEMVFDDTVTLMLRIKGSDLAAFRAGQLTRDEARARVVVREF